MEESITATEPNATDTPRLRLGDMPRGRVFMGEDHPPATPGGEDPPANTSPPVVDGGIGAEGVDGDGDGTAEPAEEEAGADLLEDSGDTPDLDEKPPYPRHKTLEAAEKSYAHAQKKLSLTTEENARLKRELEDLRRSAAETRAKEEAAAREDFTSKRYEQALEALQKLDEFDPDYKTQAAKVWSECHRDIAAWRLPESPAALSPAGETSAPAVDPAVGAVPAAGPGPAAEPTPEQIRSRIQGRMKDKGVTDADFTLEDPVFFGFASKAPTTSDDGAPLSFEAQVDWAIAQTQGHYQKLKARIRQGADQPMGRAGVATRASGQQETPRPRVTLNNLVGSSLARRVL